MSVDKGLTSNCSREQLRVAARRFQFMYRGLDPKNNFRDLLDEFQDGSRAEGFIAPRICLAPLVAGAALKYLFTGEIFLVAVFVRSPQAV